MSDSPALAKAVAGYDNTDRISGEPDAEVYRYGIGEGLACLSCDPSGARPVGREIGVRTENGTVPGTWAAAYLHPWMSSLYPSRDLSDNGSRVFFDSYGPLALADTNGKADVYQWERAGAGDCTKERAAYVAASGGCLSLISSGASASDSEFFDADPSGNNAFFATAASLLPSDPGQIDLYDARAGGGLPPPAQAGPECEGQACQSPPPPPGFQTPASSAFRGPANPIAAQAPPRCPKGKRRVRRHGKARCVARHRHRRRHHRHHRPAHPPPPQGGPMRRAKGGSPMRALGALALACLAALALAAPAQGAFGLKDLAVRSEAEDGSVQAQAGSHPFALTTHIAVNTKEGQPHVPDGEAKDVKISFPAGLAGNPTAVPRCSAVQFLSGQSGECPDASALGTAFVEFGAKGEADSVTVPVYNLYPSPGRAAKLGFIVEGKAPVTVDASLNPDPPHNVLIDSTNISQGIFFLAAEVRIWGVPADPAHDPQRGSCLFTASSCEVSLPEVPFLTLPSSCAEPLAFGFGADSWQAPAPPPYPFQGAASIQDEATPPNDLSPGGCSRLGFSPRIAAAPTSSAAASATGLDVEVSVADEGLQNPDGLAASAIRSASLTLPEGMTINPSEAEGLGTCSEAEAARESADSAPGQGCPQASKIGTVEVQTPLLEATTLHGALYVATPYENPSHSLIALYMTIREPKLGVFVSLAGKVAPDPRTGQLTGSFGEPGQELPQLPFSRFRLHFREGGRSPLVTPPSCGDYTSQASFTPYSDPGSTYETEAAFRIDSGPGGGPCPPAGAAPFAPGFEAGTASNQAGSYSPFEMRLSRQDGEQDMGKFSFVLPPGVVPKLAGIPYCPEAGIARAKSRTGPRGGAEELADPSCPAASAIGSTLAGAGVGPELTYVPGRLYLAGPYHGDPISAVAITPAVAGPFDAGVVVVREALRLNPLTHVGEVDGTASDPIPHILQGIPLELRDLRVHADRPEFTLNATSCDPSLAQATVWGDGTALAPAGETPAGLGARYQAAGCAGARLQAQARPEAARRHQAGPLPPPARRLHPPGRRRQPLPPGAALPPLGVHRTGPLPHDLHQGAVRGRGGQRLRLPAGLRLRPRPRLDPAACRAAGRPRLPALLQPQPARRRPRPARPRRHRRGGADRLRPRRPQGHRRRRPRRPRLPRDRRHAGRPEGPVRQQHQPLRRPPPRRRLLPRPERQARPGAPAGAGGGVREEAKRKEAA